MGVVSLRYNGWSGEKIWIYNSSKIIHLRLRLKYFNICWFANYRRSIFFFSPPFLLFRVKFFGICIVLMITKGVKCTSLIFQLFETLPTKIHAFKYYVSQIILRMNQFSKQVVLHSCDNEMLYIYRTF